MSEFLMTAWDGAGAVPPLMSVARALVERGHHVRVLADPVLRADVEATGAVHVSWTRAPHRKERSRSTLFVGDWGPDAFAAMRDRLAIGPAAAFAADVRAELERRPTAALLTESLLFGSLIAAEAAGVPCVVLGTTINMVPADGVPPFGPGLLPAADDQERERDRKVAERNVQMWDVALPALNAARAEHGLPPLDHVLDQARSAALVLVLTSAAFDFLGPLPPVVKHVGPRLDDLLDCGQWAPPAGDEPLVLVALSCDFQDHEDVLRRVTDAMGRLPVRAVVTTGRGVDPDAIDAPSNLQVLRLAPHRQILPEAALVVTHGGHGTTIKALAAGVPLVCLPLGRDQLDVAARVVHHGAGLRLEPSAAAEEIAAVAMKVLSEESYRQAAVRLAHEIADEVSEDRAVREIEALVEPHPPVT
ncbi:glycosyltransferase [Egicoccus sp. AB-alg6-2]|uniref:glycosyltransferase n=1 Tax=Egicoccus sp. AB-alg6-2 TaxID=3242692 RepID=UPI00359E3DF1